MDLSSVLSHGDDLFSPSKRKIDVLHKNPQDRRSEPLWWNEPVTSGVLTKDGVENIANHQYKPGKYTYLENLFNPTWVWLTEFMPMNLAPNAMTTIGLLFEIVSFCTTWYYSEEFGNVPSWVCAFNGICLFIYYTLDCMDGKQARRTGSSSPLGQLFDHGVDCLCLATHASNLAACLNLGGSHWLVLGQSTILLSFFLGQWEEYYTGVLEHAQGDWLGVTEMAYGMALFSLLNSLVDREAVWGSPMSSYTPSALDSLVPKIIASLELRQFSLILLTISFMGHVVASTTKVSRHIQEPKAVAVAFSKLTCPLLMVATPFLLPSDVISESARFVSLSMSLAFSVITIKIIVFSMAKMAYASVQRDALLFVLVCVWSRCDDRLTALGARFFFQMCCVWYGYRIVTWTHTAIGQLCDRLDINCFTIKKSKQE